MNPLLYAAFTVCMRHHTGIAYDPGYEKCVQIEQQYMAENKNEELERAKERDETDRETLNRALSQKK